MGQEKQQFRNMGHVAKSAFDERWLNLAGAAADTRDALRRLLPRLDTALVSGEGPRVLLEDARAIAARYATVLTLALKSPEGPRVRQSADSEGGRGISAVTSPPPPAAR